MSEALAAEPQSNVIPITTTPADPKRTPKLYAALAKAQTVIENADMNSTNPGFKRGNVEAKYADLASVMNAIRQPLAANGIALLHTVSVDRAFAWVAVTARLVHESGEYLENEIVLPVLQKTPQGVGSSMTYGRRYTACALTGLAQEDDDGMGGPMVPTGKAPPKPKSPPLSAQQTEQPKTEKAPASEMSPYEKTCAFLLECQFVSDVDKLSMNTDQTKFSSGERDTLAKLFRDRRKALAPK